MVTPSRGGGTMSLETCDRCGPAVSAQYLIKLLDGQLSFCGHHYRKNQEALDKMAFEVVELSVQEELVEAE